MTDRCVALWAWFIALQCTGGLHHRQGNAARWAEILTFFDPHFSTSSFQEETRVRTNGGRSLRRALVAATFGLVPNVAIGLAC